MIPTIHPVLHALIGTGAGGDGMEVLIVFAIYFAVVALCLVVMTWQGIALVWFWRASRRADGEQLLTTRRARVFKVVNWLWLGILAWIGYCFRNEGPIEDTWLFVWFPLASFMAMTVLNLMSLHRHAAVSFALLVGTLLYFQVIVPTVTSRLQQRAHQQEIQDLFRPEAVANRERFQREEFGQQQRLAKIGLISQQIDDKASSLARIRHLLQSGNAIGDAARGELRRYYIDRVSNCNQLRQTLKHTYAHEYHDGHGTLENHIELILSWSQEPWLTEYEARQIEMLKLSTGKRP